MEVAMTEEGVNSKESIQLKFARSREREEAHWQRLDDDEEAHRHLGFGLEDL